MPEGLSKIETVELESPKKKYHPPPTAANMSKFTTDALLRSTHPQEYRRAPLTILGFIEKWTRYIPKNLFQHFWDDLDRVAVAVRNRTSGAEIDLEAADTATIKDEHGVELSVEALCRLGLWDKTQKILKISPETAEAMDYAEVIAFTAAEAEALGIV